MTPCWPAGAGPAGPRRCRSTAAATVPIQWIFSSAVRLADSGRPLSCRCPPCCAEASGSAAAARSLSRASAWRPVILLMIEKDKLRSRSSRHRADLRTVTRAGRRRLKKIHKPAACFSGAAWQTQPYSKARQRTTASDEPAPVHQQCLLCMVVAAGRPAGQCDLIGLSSTTLAGINLSLTSADCVETSSAGSE